MTFYQELQLSQAGSKAYIKSFKTRREKAKHTAIYFLKILLNLAFSTAVIILSGIIFGPQNFVGGLVVLLAIMTFRFSDFGIHANQSVANVFILFGVFAIGPKLSNMVPVGWAFCINAVGIFLIVLFGCQNVKMMNHATMVLSYILLCGSNPVGMALVKRELCLLVGAVFTAMVFYRNHRRTVYESGFSSIFKEFSLSSDRSRWQIRIALCVASAMMIAQFMGVTKYTWAGIAAMSVTFPYSEKLGYRSQYRILGNIFGSLLFLAISLLLPESMLSYYGYFGGIGLALSVLYGWQTLFNSFSALSAAAMTYGVQTAVMFRIFNNVFGAIYALVFNSVFDFILRGLDKMIRKIKGCRKKAPENTSDEPQNTQA